MNEYLTNKLLGSYYFMDAVLPACIDRHTLFDKLSRAYLKKRGGEKLYYKATRPAIEEIDAIGTFNMYERFKRLGEASATDEEDEFILIKGKALSRASRCELTGAHGVSFDVIGSLASASESGIIGAMTTYGFILCEGLGVARNLSVGQTLLAKASRWNDVDALVLGIFYDEERRRENIGRLGTLLWNTPYRACAEEIADYYGMSAEKNELVKVTAKLFSMGIASPEKYDLRFDRIIASKLLKTSEKNTTVLSGSGELVAVVSDLPTRMTAWEKGNVRFTSPRPGREEIEREIVYALENADLAGEDVYRPLCLACDDSYLLSGYADSITAALEGAHVAKIDVGALPAAKFEPTENNIFVRSVREKKLNAAVITLTGENNPAVTEAVEEFLQAGLRREFRLRFGVRIDLSGVLPIVLSDRAHAKAMEKVCNVLEVPVIDGNEKREVLKGELEKKCARYGAGNVTLEGDALAKLEAVGIDRALKVLERIALSSRGKDVSVDEKQIEEFIKACSGNGLRSFGFGLQ